MSTPTPRALGWRKDSPDERDYKHADLMKARAPRTLAGGSMLAFRGPRQEQGQAGACVAFAGSRIIHMGLAIQGIDVELPSQRFGYEQARKQEFAGQDPTKVPRLTDDGSQPRLYLKGAQGVGIVAQHDCPYDWRLVNKPVTPLVYAAAYDQTGLTYYRLDDTRTGLFDKVASAVKRGVPVMFALNVDRAFMDVNSSRPITSLDHNEIVGGHMLAVLEVRDDSILFDNWWGTDWGFDGEGYALMSKACFEREAHDVLGILSVPQLTKRWQKAK